MKSPATSPKLRDYGLMLARGWATILCTTVLAAGVGYLSWRESTPVYQSSTKVLVTSPGAATTFDAFYGQLNSMSRSYTYQRLALSPKVTQPTIEQLGLSETTGDLASHIVVPPSLTNVFDLTVSGVDPERTRQTADAVTANLVNLSRQMATVDGSGIELVQFDKASPAHRVGSMWRLIVQGAVLGLVLSMVLVIAWSLLSDRLLGRGQIARVPGQLEVDLV